MGKSDCATKAFLSKRNVFADLVNFSFFGGKKVVAPDDLQETNCNEVVSFCTTENGTAHRERLRDLAMNVVMRQAGGTKYIVVGVENQRRTHLAMPARCMLYDAMRHTENLRRMVETNKRRNAEREFLSGLRKEDRLPPVVTLVIYWGHGAWKGPRSLHDMIDFPKDSLKKLCADYRLNLIEPASMGDSDFKRFRTDLGAVLHYIKLQDDGGKWRQLSSGNKRCRTLSREAAVALQAVTGADFPIDEQEETIDMCKAVRQIKQWGYEEGRQNGFEEGEQSGFTKGIQKTISILKKLQLDMEQIQERLMEEYGLSATEAQKFLLNP